MAIRSTILINAGIALIFSILFNSLLVFLVLKHTAIKMKGYSRLILVHCVSDIFYNFVQFSIGGVSYFTPCL
jgi:uncharacterized protein YqhQ